MDRTIRTFIALDIPEPVKDAIEQFQRGMKDPRADVKWVRPDAMHVTLKFLGDVPENRIPELGTALGHAVSSFAPFSLILQGAGCFPNERQPRVFWVGIGEGSEKLIRLAAAIDSVLEPLGFPREKRPFSAHITLGRVREHGGVQHCLEGMKRQFTCDPFPADAVLLMKSDLRPQGPIYSVLQSIKMEGTFGYGRKT